MSNEKIILRNRLRRHRNAVVGTALVVMLWLGYKLAGYEAQYYQQQIEELERTIDRLNDESNALSSAMHQAEANSLVCQAQTDVQQQKIEDQNQQIKACEKNIVFYQHVMAPELAGDMLAADQVKVIEDESNPNSFILDMVLVQPRANKAVISGRIKISAEMKDGTLLKNIGSIDYRFKYFQQVKYTFSLSLNEAPSKLVFTSDVVQYKRVREQYKQVIDWADLFE